MESFYDSFFNRVVFYRWSKMWVHKRRPRFVVLEQVTLLLVFYLADMIIF